MPGKYVKLEKGERKAIRQTGARKEAKKGIMTEIYSGQKGGGIVTANKSTKGRSSTNQGAVTLQGRTAEVKLKSKPGTQSEKAAEFERQAKINQSEFEKTRLGSRILKKANKAAAKSGSQLRRQGGQTKGRNKL